MHIPITAISNYITSFIFLFLERCNKQAYGTSDVIYEYAWHILYIILCFVYTIHRMRGTITYSIVIVYDIFHSRFRINAQLLWRHTAAAAHPKFPRNCRRIVATLKETVSRPNTEDDGNDGDRFDTRVRPQLNRAYVSRQPDAFAELMHEPLIMFTRTNTAVWVAGILGLREWLRIYVTLGSPSPSIESLRLYS